MQNIIHHLTYKNAIIAGLLFSSYGVYVAIGMFIGYIVNLYRLHSGDAV